MRLITYLHLVQRLIMPETIPIGLLPTMPGHSMWTKWHQDKFLSKFSTLTVTLPSSRAAISFIYHRHYVILIIYIVVT